MLLNQVFDEKIAVCAIEMMNSYGVQIQAVSEKLGNRVQANEQAAVIGYSGGNIPGGSMALWINQSLLKRTGAEMTDTADWLGELSNQLLGRVLNQLLPFGVELLQGTPVVIKGTQLSMSFAGGRTKQYYFADLRKEMLMAVFFDASYAENFEVQQEKAESTSMTEGDSVLF